MAEENTRLDEKALVRTEVNDREITITDDEREVPLRASNVVFTATGNNYYTDCYRNPDTCCTCLSQ